MVADTTAADKTNGLRWYYYALEEDAPDSDTEPDCDLGSASEGSVDSLPPLLPTLSPWVGVSIRLRIVVIVVVAVGNNHIITTGNTKNNNDNEDDDDNGNIRQSGWQRQFILSVNGCFFR